MAEGPSVLSCYATAQTTPTERAPRASGTGEETQEASTHKNKCNKLKHPSPLPCERAKGARRFLQRPHYYGVIIKKSIRTKQGSFCQYGPHEATNNKAAAQEQEQQRSTRRSGTKKQTPPCERVRGARRFPLHYRFAKINTQTNQHKKTRSSYPQHPHNNSSSAE